MSYRWPEKHYPDLLKRGKGDPYQHLKVDLRGLWKDRGGEALQMSPRSSAPLTTA